MQGSTYEMGLPVRTTRATYLCCLGELAQRGERSICTIEGGIAVRLPNVEQLECDLDNESAVTKVLDTVSGKSLDVLFVSSSADSLLQNRLCRHALSAAESGQLVFVQMEAESTAEAQKIFEDAVDHSIADHLVGVSCQRLIRDPDTDGRMAQYEFVSGSLGG